MGGIFGGDGPEPPVLPPPPPPFKFGSFKDLLNNVEVIQTTGPDGKEHFVQKEITLDPLAQAFVDQAKQRIGGLINDIMTVAQENPRLIAPFQGFLNEVSQLNDQDLADWTGTVRPEDFSNFKRQLIETNTFLNNEKWDDYDHQLELNLTARGLANSTVANEQRALSMRNRQLTNNQIRLDSEIIGDQLVNTDLARKTALYQGRSASRSRSADISSQKFGLEQEAVNRELLGRDDRMNKLMQLLGINQNVVNEDINRKRGANIAPTVLGAQDAITGHQKSAWAQDNANRLSLYNIENQSYANNNALTGSLIGGAMNLGGSLALAYGTGGASMAAPTIASRVVSQARNRNASMPL